MKLEGNLGYRNYLYYRSQKQPKNSPEEVKKTKDQINAEAEASAHKTSADQQNNVQAKGVVWRMKEGHYQSVFQLIILKDFTDRFQRSDSKETKTAEMLNAEGELLTTAVKNKIASFYTPLAPPEEAESSSEALATLDIEDAIKDYEDAVVSDVESHGSEPTTLETFKELYSNALQALMDKLKLADSQTNNDIEDPARPILVGNDEVTPASDNSGESRNAQLSQSVMDGSEKQFGVPGELNILKSLDEALDSSVTAIQNEVIGTTTRHQATEQPAGSAEYYKNLYGTAGQLQGTVPSEESNNIETKA